MGQLKHGRRGGGDEGFWFAYRDFYEDGVPDTRAAEVRAGDATATERAARFLELDPQCYRSGYAKERLLRALKSARLTQSQIERLRVAMMRAVMKVATENSVSGVVLHRSSTFRASALCSPSGFGQVVPMWRVGHGGPPNASLVEMH
jgi:hypothetical protein